MRIGELAERSGVSRRLLRYYEEQQLIGVGRSANGYREYDELAVGRVRQIRELLEAGLPTRLIREILPCLSTPRSSVRFSDALPSTVELLERERDRMTERIEVLTRNRDAIAGYLEAVRPRAGADGR